MGRHLDVSRDSDIHRVTLDLLCENGYDRLTIDAVAARAHAGKATIYRRWPGKADLVVDALTTIDSAPLAAPDTGSLRGDLLALMSDASELADEARVSLMAGLVPALRRDPDLARTFEERFVGPRQRVVHEVFEQGRARGEVSAAADVELLATTVAGLIMFRVLVQQQPVDQAWAGRVIDVVVTPAARRQP